MPPRVGVGITFVYVLQVKLADIGGLEEAKAALHEMIVLPRTVCAVLVYV